MTMVGAAVAGIFITPAATKISIKPQQQAAQKCWRSTLREVADRFRRVRKEDMPPTGSLYNPEVISVIGWTIRRPFPRHQRKRSELRGGTMMPASKLSYRTART
jgi:hypothetical protein